MTTEYLIIEEAEPPARIKTKRWVVWNKRVHVAHMSLGALGRIEWYGPWRQYCYMSTIQAVYSKGCLRDIADFIEEQMEERKAKAVREDP